jgi:hypothetical protein
VLPSLLFFPHSARTTAPSEQDIAGSAFDAFGLVGYVAPDLIAPPTAADHVPYTQSPLALLLTRRTDLTGKQELPNYNYTEYAVFTGTLGLLLAVAGAFAARGRRRGFTLVAYAFALGLALYLPGLRLLFGLPLVQNVWPMRWLAPATLLVAWLAALGCERLAQAGRRLPFALGTLALLLAATTFGLLRLPAAAQAADPAWAPQRIAERFGVGVQDVRNHVQDDGRFAATFARAAEQGTHAALWMLLAAGLLFAIGSVRTPRARTWLLRLGAAATVLQLGWHGAALTPGCALRQPTDTAAHAFLRERARDAAADGGFTIVRASREPKLPDQLPPGELMAPGVRDLHFYSHYDGRSAQPIAAMLGPHWGPLTAAKGYLVLSLPDTLPTPSEPSPESPYAFGSPLEHPLLDLLGVRFVLSTDVLQHAGARVGPALRGPRGEFCVYERPHPLPRAFTVPVLRTLPGDTEVIAALVDPQLAPRAQAFVVAADAPPEAAAAVHASPRDVRFVTDHPTAMELEVGPGRAPWLVLADTFLPGWSATVDGEPVPIRRANHSQRVVPLHEGACRVRFVYTCPGLVPGLGLAALAGSVLLALSIWSHRRAPADPAC